MGHRRIQNKRVRQMLEDIKTDEQKHEDDEILVEKKQTSPENETDFTPSNPEK